MKFPKSYPFLDKNKFSKGEYNIIPIRYEDRIDIMKWRNEQIYHLRQNKILTEIDQEQYFKHTVSKLFDQDKPEQILFSYLKKDKCIGYGGLVHINWIDKNAEISFIMDTQLEKNEFELHWVNYLDLIEQVAFKELSLHKIYTYAFDLRPHLYSAIEKAGFTKEAILKEHCCFEGKFKNVVIHSKHASKLTIRKITEPDIDFVYLLSNDSITRENSYNQEPISYKNHTIWFNNKLSEKVFYYIGEVNKQPASFIRIDIQNGENVIGISIDKKFRGQGFAPFFLKAISDKFIEIYKNQTIIAYIKQKNIASIKSFEKAGFFCVEDCSINNEPSKKYIYDPK